MLQRFAIAALPVTPWKNGGGNTREIACWPPGAGFEDFDWRLSIASIAASGPFSRFAGVDRIITLLNGEGVHLRGEGVDHRLDTPLLPYAFSGDVAIHGTLLGAVQCSDFNVMTRRGRLRARVQVLRDATHLAPAPHGMLLAWQGDWQAGGQALGQGQGLWWADAPTHWHVEKSVGDAPAALLAVQWHVDEGACP